MTKIKSVLADNRTHTLLKVAGALLALLGLVVGGVAADPVIFPN